MLGIRSPFRPKSTPKINNIQAHELQQRLEQGAALTLIDVRSAQEFANGHVANSRLLPLSSVTQRQAEIPRDQPVVVICRSGARSRAAIEQLLSLGITNLLNLDGGLIGWQRVGYPLVAQR